MWSVIIPIMVAISAFGGLSVHIMTSSRMCFVGARNGHMPSFLSHINMNKFTPVPSLVFLVRKYFAFIIGIYNETAIFNFQCILSLLMLVVSDVYVLITYSSIVESFFIMLTVSAVLYFRYKHPNMERPIKVRQFYLLEYNIFLASNICWIHFIFYLFSTENNGSYIERRCRCGFQLYLLSFVRFSL